MNATLPVSQIPIASDPAQPSAAAAAKSVTSGGKGRDFAAALSNAGPKPARKAGGAKPADAGAVGGHLPAPGNLSPPLAAPPTTLLTSPLTPGSLEPSAAAGAAAIAAATVGGAPIPGAAVGAAAPAPIASTATGSPAASISGSQAVAGADQNPGSTPVDSPVAAPGAQGATSAGAEISLAPGLPVDHAGEAGAPSGDPAATPSAVAAVAASGAAAPPAKGAAGAAAAAAASTAPGGAAAGTAAGAANKRTTVAATAAVNAAASRPTGTTEASSPRSTAPSPPSTNSSAGSSADANAQAVTAAAMSAAATGSVAAGGTGIAHGADLSALLTDDSAAPATTAKSLGAGGPSGPPVPAPVISLAAAAVSAKAAAPAVAALAGAAAADKHASGAAADSPLSGTSVVGAAGAAQLSVNPTTVADATATPPPPTLKVAAGVETPEFGQGLADRVSFMVDNNLNGAKLQVNPPQLGPIEVRIALQGSHAQVWLTSHSAVTRDALESSSPKLREMLGAQGFGQVSVDISQRSYQDRSAYSQPYESIPSASGSRSAPDLQSTASAPARISSGAVDAYA